MGDPYYNYYENCFYLHKQITFQRFLCNAFYVTTPQVSLVLTHFGCFPEMSNFSPTTFAEANRYNTTS